MSMGALHEDSKTLVLLGTDARFWEVFSTTTEAMDRQPHPIDRYSQRVVPQIADITGAVDIAYPFGGPPYAPFIAWAKATGEAFDSPTGMLVHIRAGLMISYRGALIFDGEQPLTKPAVVHPCTTCTGRPCEDACPVEALSTEHFYDVPVCKEYLGTHAGETCMTQGCAVRRACPISKRFDRPEAQSAYHMRQFKGA
jgi:epoxyqueuosine reductase